LLAAANCSGVVNMDHLLKIKVHSEQAKFFAGHFHPRMLRRTMALIIGRIVLLSTKLLCGAQ
jgi:hypothetical protein